LKSFEELIFISNEKNISRFIFLSSAAIYSLKNTRIKKENLNEIPSTNYGKEKLIIEKKLKKLNSNITKIIFRISNIFDNNFDPNKNFIDKLIDNKLHNRFTKFSGSIYDIRDFVNIEFIVKIIVKSFNKKLKSKYNIFNLSSGYGISYIEIINLLKYNNIIFNKKNKATKIILSNNKLFRIFGVYFKNPDIKLKKYIKKYIK
jgi:UDP-glucose 4-epimerase